MGRPSDYTKAIADEICERLSEGESLRAICLGNDMPNKATVFRWLAGDEAFRDQYARAREAQADVLVDEMIDIADGKHGGEDVQRDRLSIDARKWAASKLKPKTYGDKVKHVGGDEGDNPIAFTGWDISFGA